MWSRTTTSLAGSATLLSERVNRATRLNGYGSTFCPQSDPFFIV
jgi:hypothetical protein